MENNDIEQQLVVQNTTKLINDSDTKYTHIFLCKITLFTIIFVFLILYFVLR